jgi:hypothetical protein
MLLICIPSMSTFATSTSSQPFGLNMRRTALERDRLPIGKKKARQAKADAKLVKAIISEVVLKNENKVGGSKSVVSAYELSGESGGVNSAGAMMGYVLQNISSVIANVGTELLENMKAEQNMRFLVQSLDTPDRKMYAEDEQLALRWAETRDKRRRIELPNRGGCIEFPNRGSSTEEQGKDNQQHTTAQDIE